ncbi:MAG: NAD-dependent epimerase/dehydratase family protein [Caulobacteraceae bacterium]|nr:NAD-dependent epimerase/dehydratase family protein [Caulobacteraceae bacterium]
MRVLLTGASSFTGAWFVHALAEAGHEVVAPLRAAGGYDDPIRRRRVAALEGRARLVPAAPFGSAAFLALIAAEGPFDVLCCHGAETADYKSPGFDADAAVAANTAGLPQALEAMKAAGGRRLVVTGTVFEGGEGRGTEPLADFSPYGASKRRTAEIMAAEAAKAGLEYVKFVIPNPFGPHEGPTFQRRVMSGWAAGEAIHVSHPLYVRDNVPVDLLALAYARAVEGRSGAHSSPSFYAGPVGAFFERMAQETRARTGLACRLTLADSQSFDEPEARINLEPLNPADHGWSEAAFWDAYVAHYA